MGNVCIAQVCDLLEMYAPLSLQEDYDNSGLIVGDKEWELRGILITLDITEDVIQEAIEKGCNCVVAHHPIIFKGLKKVVGKSLVERCVIMAIENKIALYASHTNFDFVGNGTSKTLADQLQLKNIEVLDPRPQIAELLGLESVGSGIVGTLEEPLEENDFFSLLRKCSGAEVIKHSRFRGKPIYRVAVCGGSGSFLSQKAIEEKADVFISSEFKYHDYHDLADDIIIADIGHFESEQFTKQAFFEILQKKFSKFAVCFAEKSLNPVKYYYK